MHALSFEPRARRLASDTSQGREDSRACVGFRSPVGRLIKQLTTHKVIIRVSELPLSVAVADVVVVVLSRSLFCGFPEEHTHPERRASCTLIEGEVPCKGVKESCSLILAPAEIDQPAEERERVCSHGGG